MRGFLYYWLLHTLILNLIFCEKELFFDLEGPVIAYFNPMVLSNFTIKSIRYSRRDPVHYVNIYFTNTLPCDESFQVKIYFYELVANTYRTTFIEFHYNYCYLLEKDELIGVYFRNAVKGHSIKCPVLPGTHNIANISFPRSTLIKRLPFRQGRIVVNMTSEKHGPVSNWHIDFEIKPYKKHSSKLCK